MDFSKLKFQIQNIPQETKVTDAIPELKNIFSPECVVTDAQIRYIIYCYSENSPLLRIDDIKVRKRKAWELAGGEESDEALMMFSYDNEEVNQAIIQYCKFQNNISHMELILQTEALFKYHIDLLSASKGTDKKQTIETIDLLRESIDKISNKHFKGDEEMTNYVASYHILEQRKIYPEEYAT